jgi:hypothetical protein
MSKQTICRDIKSTCRWLNHAHSLKEHDQMEKTEEYQLVVQSAKTMNNASDLLKLPCKCKELHKKGSKKHTGHKFIKIDR